VIYFPPTDYQVLSANESECAFCVRGTELLNTRVQLLIFKNVKVKPTHITLPLPCRTRRVLMLKLIKLRSS